MIGSLSYYHISARTRTVRIKADKWHLITCLNIESETFIE